jgi:hypothetical protein
MTKVEELREGTIQAYAVSPLEIEPMRRRLNVLIAAAHAEEKERIRITTAGELRIYMTPDCTRHIKVSTGIKPGSYKIISISSLDPSEGE